MHSASFFLHQWSKNNPPFRTLIFQSGFTNKMPGLYLGLKRQSEMNFVGKNIAVLYSGQGQGMRLSHVQYSITKSHHPLLRACPKTMPVSHWHFLKLKKWFAERWRLSVLIWWGQSVHYLYFIKVCCQRSTDSSDLCLPVATVSWCSTRKTVKIQIMQNRSQIYCRHSTRERTNM